MTDPERQARPSGNDSWEAVSFLHALAAAGADALAGWMAANNLDETAVEWLRVRDLAPFTYSRLSRAGLLDQAAPTPAALLRLAHYAATDDAGYRARDLRWRLGGSRRSCSKARHSQLQRSLLAVQAKQWTDRVWDILAFCRIRDVTLWLAIIPELRCSLASESQPPS